MAGVIITGKEEGPDGKPGKHFVPRHARYRVETVPDARVVAKGTASGSVALDLDPGKYRIKVTKYVPVPDTNQQACLANWEHYFYVGMTEQMWNRIRFLQPRWVDMMHTTDGVRFKCTFCGDVNMSKQGALLHEYKDHFGIDPMEATDEEMDAAAIGQNKVNPIPGAMKRGPGRPRKDATEA